VDFIERYLDFWPDHGDGSFEVMLLIALVTIITGIAMGFFHKRDVRNKIKRWCAWTGVLAEGVALRDELKGTLGDEGPRADQKHKCRREKKR
jgi:hypothetical protein